MSSTDKDKKAECDHVFGEHPMFGLLECELCGHPPPPENEENDDNHHPPSRDED